MCGVRAAQERATTTANTGVSPLRRKSASAPQRTSAFAGDPAPSVEMTDLWGGWRRAGSVVERVEWDAGAGGVAGSFGCAQDRLFDCAVCKVPNDFAQDDVFFLVRKRAVERSSIPHPSTPTGKERLSRTPVFHKERERVGHPVLWLTCGVGSESRPRSPSARDRGHPGSGDFRSGLQSSGFAGFIRGASAPQRAKALAGDPAFAPRWYRTRRWR